MVNFIYNQKLNNMKKLLASTPFILGALLGLLAMNFSITGKLHTTASAEIFIFSMGFAITVFSTYAAYQTVKELS